MLSVVGDVIDHSHLPYKVGAIIFLVQASDNGHTVSFATTLPWERIFLVDIIKRLLIHECVTS